MREVINIFIGQAGCQIGNAAWELYGLEHGFEPNGRFKPEFEEANDAMFEAFYNETPSGQYVPRALFVDLEPSVIDEIRTGTYKSLFHPDQLITGNEDAANNYARGSYSIGCKYYDTVLDQLRRMADECDNIQAFVQHHAYGGGTGSGFFTGIVERINQEYGKRTKLSYGAYPSPTLSTCVVEPYNAVLAMRNPIELIDAAFFFDNEALYNICTKFLSIDNPNYTHLNRIATQVLSSITASLRFLGALNADIMDYQTNLIPYPRIHFPLVNFAPIVSKARADHQTMSTIELTRTVFEKESQMMKCDPLSGKYMSCCLLYRGDVCPRNVNAAITEIKKKCDIKFVDWCPTGFKVGINRQPTTAVPGSGLAMSKRSICMLANNTSMGQVLSRLNRKFDLMFSKKAFVHWYVGEGMEEGEMIEAREDLVGLEQDYLEVGVETEIVENEGDEPSPQYEPESQKTETHEADMSMNYDDDHQYEEPE